MKTHILRRADLVLIGVLILLSAAALLLLSGGGDTVTVRQNGAVVYSGSLRTDRRIEVGGDHHNLVVIENGCVYMAEADCPGGDCLRQAPLRGKGQIACAPNGVIVTVSGDPESGVDVLAG